MDELLKQMAENVGIETGGMLTKKGSDVIAPPEISQTKSGAYLFDWNSPTGERIVAKVEHTYIAGRELWTSLSVVYQENDLGDPVPVLTKTRWNMRSSSSNDSQVRQLNRRIDRNWDARLAQIHYHVETNFSPGSELSFLGDGEPTGPPQMLVAPFIEEGQHNVIAAYGGTGKSMFALGLAISVADGLTVMPGLEVKRKVKTLYVDWEASRDVHDHRYRLLLAGIEAGNVDQMIGYINLSLPLFDAFDHVRDVINKHNFEFVVFDSASRAVGGETVDEGSVINYFNSVASLGVTALTIAHKPKDERSRGPAGNSHWYHQARSYWELDKDQIPGDERVQIILTHEKSNNGALQKSMSYMLDFRDDAISYNKADANDSATLGAKLKDSERVYHFVRFNPGVTAKEIAEELSINQPAKVNNILKRGEGRIYVGSNDRRDRTWALLQRDPAPEPRKRPDGFQWW